MKIKRLLIITFCTLFYLNPAMSQVTTASITGKVVDKTGEALPGATVQAIHEPSGTQYGIAVLPDGRFNLPNMRVGGPYTIEGRFLGYKPQKYTDVYLSLGQKLTVNFDLESEATALEDVVITASPDEVLNSDRTGAGTNINNEQLKILPTISRSASDIYRLNPASDGNSFGGRNDQFNNFSLDGSIFNNPFGLDAATPGGQTDAQPISLDAIDQIQVSIAPYDVTQAGFTGASINAVTKSGTNEFHGTVFGFFRNENLTGSRVNDNDIFVPDLTQFQTGFSLGGPIIKNKLFFFVNFEMERREDLGSNFFASGTIVTGENVSRVEAADLNLVSRTLFDRLGYETGPYEGYTHDTENEKGILKLDWNISQHHTLTAIYNFLDASKQKTAHPSALGRRGPDATTLQFFNSGYQINNEINSGLIELKSIFGNKFSNKLQVGYTSFRDSRDPFSAPFPVLNINRDGIRYIVAGHEPFSINNRLDQDVFQITNNFEVYAGAHNFTFGGSLERFDFNNSFNLGVYEPFNYPYNGGTFGPGFESVQAFVDYVDSDSLNFIADFAQGVFDSNNANDSWALAETNVGQLAFYVQDRWYVNQNLTLTLGIRMDLPLYFDTEDKIRENIERKGGLFAEGGSYDPSVVYFDENGNPVTFDHTVLPDQRPLFSPRFGFNWNVNGVEDLQLRGGTGLFTGRFPFVWVGNQVANPDWFFYNIAEPDFKFPQVWRSNLGIDKRLGNGLTVSADFIYTRDVNAMIVRNYGLRPPTGTLGGVDNRPVYVFEDRAIFSGLGFDLPTNAYVFTNSDEGKSFNFTLELKKNWSNGFYASLAYNFLDAKDISSIEAEISSDAYDRNPAFGHVNTPQLAPSLYGNKHRILGTANKKFSYNNGKLATTVSLFFEYAKGGRFSYTYSGDINGDASALNDLIYIPTDSELDQMSFAPPVFPGNPTENAQREALRAFIAQDDYLSENRGNYAEKYALLSPWFSRWDLRVLQDLVFNDNNSLQLSIDLLNLGNFINSNWGVRQFPQNTQPIGVTVDPDGNPTYSFDTNQMSTFVDDFSLASRWQMQIGLRYTF